MNPIANIILTATAAAITLSFAARAATLKPLQGATFNAGTHRAAVLKG
jgi:hypothetical protein